MTDRMVSRRSVSAGTVVWAWFRLIHPFPACVVTATGLGIALAASPTTLDQALRILGMVFGSQVAVGSFNEFCDADLDAAGQTSKPIPSGLVPRWGALGLAAVGLACCLGFSASFGLVTLAIAIVGCKVGALYDYPLKRTRWSWAPYVVDVPLLPMWVWSAVGVLTPGLFWLYPAGGLLAMAAHIANALPDDAADRAAGTWTIVQHLGVDRSILVLRATFFAAGLVGPLALYPSRLSAAVLVMGLAALVVGGAGTLLMATASRRRPAFRLVALGAGIFGIAVGIAIR